MYGKLEWVSIGAAFVYVIFMYALVSTLKPYANANHRNIGRFALSERIVTFGFETRQPSGSNFCPGFQPYTTS